jgi:hypothetical protein
MRLSGIDTLAAGDAFLPAFMAKYKPALPRRRGDAQEPSVQGWVDEHPGAALRDLEDSRDALSIQRNSAKQRKGRQSYPGLGDIFFKWLRQIYRARLLRYM